MRTAATTVRNRDRAPVTRDLIFRRALDIIDTEGLEALTMRRLAADLGVEAASLYHHVPSKQALLDGAVSVMRESMVFGDPLPNDWREIMAMVFLRYLDVLTAHPHMLPLATRRVDSDHVDGLAYLVTLGIAEADAVALWQSLLAFVVGFAGLATSTTRADTGHLPDEIARRMTRWEQETAQRGLAALLAAYDIAAPFPAPASDPRSSGRGDAAVARPAEPGAVAT